MKVSLLFNHVPPFPNPHPGIHDFLLEIKEFSVTQMILQ